VTQRAQTDAVSARSIALEPMLVNLADGSGSSYLRVSMTLKVADSADKKGAKAKDDKGQTDKASEDGVAAIRDTVLSVLGRQTSDGLLAVDGKERLKAELRRALNERNSDLKVLDVFVTDFLVQR
jgi:flagellar protein FliL